ncbi:MAG TPA: sigma factor-like helix-turn-helix DNA-binding protein [Candidatus Angelobacter sp.]|nr:sigma factor-like helix-turn-helix DNA-binding protein [Candidatus Angelobacter sp.]
MELTTQDVQNLAVLLGASEEVAATIAADYTDSLKAYRAQHTVIDGDRWLVLTLICYGIDVDGDLQPETFKSSSVAPIEITSREQISSALQEVPLTERFCFLLRYLLKWEIRRIAKLLDFEGQSVELAIAHALYKIREQILSTMQVGAANAIG